MSSDTVFALCAISLVYLLGFWVLYDEFVYLRKSFKSFKEEFGEAADKMRFVYGDFVSYRCLHRELERYTEHYKIDKLCSLNDSVQKLNKKIKRMESENK